MIIIPRTSGKWPRVIAIPPRRKPIMAVNNEMCLWLASYSAATHRYRFLSARAASTHPSIAPASTDLETQICLETRRPVLFALQVINHLSRRSLTERQNQCQVIRGARPGTTHSTCGPRSALVLQQNQSGDLLFMIWICSFKWKINAII